MEINGKSVVAVCAGLLAFFVVRAAMTPHTPTAEEGKQAVAKTMAELQEKAQARGGHESKSDATAGAATDMATRQLADAPAAKRPALAASPFIGFYYVNSVVMRDVCQAEGVDIGAYVEAFRNEHTAEHARAATLVQAAGFSEDQVTGALAANRGQVQAMIQQTMRDTAAQLGKTTVKEGCTIFAEHPAIVANARKLSTMSPGMWKAFMAPG
jgi:flagellar motor protein MotB